MKPIQQKAEPRDGEKPSPDDLIWAKKPAPPEAILALGFLVSQSNAFFFFHLNQFELSFSQQKEPSLFISLIIAVTGNDREKDA